MFCFKNNIFSRYICTQFLIRINMELLLTEEKEKLMLSLITIFLQLINFIFFLFFISITISYTYIHIQTYAYYIQFKLYKSFWIISCINLYISLIYNYFKFKRAFKRFSLISPFIVRKQSLCQCFMFFFFFKPTSFFNYPP